MAHALFKWPKDYFEDINASHKSQLKQNDLFEWFG